MTKLVFASSNQNKIREISEMIPDNYKVISSRDAGIEEEIEENSSSFEGNAELKAEYIFRKTGLAAFADDSGLVVESLNGEPDVRSARYAGSPSDSEKNMKLLLENLKSISNRKAIFVSVFCFIDGNNKQFFRGELRGSITHEKKGNKGFGYDPVFIPEGLDKTFAEMEPVEKNRISHRRQALDKLVDYLENL